MFIKFSESKAHYEKGQVFPFVIAIIAVVIIMAMITANLGKLSLFKTDVSNAADAGALGGVSVLSGTLLALGLLSDTWCGKAVVVTARMLEILVLGRDDINLTTLMSSLGTDNSDTDTTENADGSYTTTTTETNSSNETTTTTTDYDSSGNQTDSDTDTDSSNSYQRFGPDLVGCIKVYIPHIIQYIPDYIKAFLDGQMAWANAKQTALRLAFQNSGIDEYPNTQFKHYQGSYDEYLNTFLAQDANQTGFSRFMSHTLSGYWNNNGVGLPTVEPKMEMPPVTITSGYGWTQEADESFSSSYPGNNWRVKDNYVEVEVSGSMLYPIETLTFTDYFGTDVVNTLTAIATIGAYCKYCGWTGGEGDPTVKSLIKVYGLGYLLAAVYAAVAGAAFRGMIEYMPCGFTFPDRDMAKQTTDNPLKVKVTRHKKNTDMGIWNFQYGDVTARSAGHAFQDENPLGDVTIEPVLIDGMKDLGSFLGQYTGNIGEDSFASIEMVETIVRGFLCMGMVATMGGLLMGAAGDIIGEAWEEFDDNCDWDDNPTECAIRLATAQQVSGVFGGGLGTITGVILQYLIYQALCGSSNSFFQPDSGDASLNEDAISDNEDPNNWFTTSLHLFETELVPGFLQ